MNKAQELFFEMVEYLVNKYNCEIEEMKLDSFNLHVKINGNKKDQSLCYIEIDVLYKLIYQRMMTDSDDENELDENNTFDNWKHLIV